MYWFLQINRGKKHNIVTSIDNNGQTIRYQINNRLVKKVPGKAIGVPQGVVLSPILFYMFTSEFRTLTDVQLALFANDSALFSTHAKAGVIIDRLQSACNTIKRY
jgi:hypothetical protein